MNRVNGLIFALIFALGLAGGIVLASFVATAELRTLRVQRDAPPTCVVGEFLVSSEFGMFVLGDQQLCGHDLQFGPITGPSQLR